MVNVLGSQETKEERWALFYRLEVGITLQRHYRGWMVAWPSSWQAGAWDGRTYTEEYFETGAQFDESGYRKAQRHVRYLKARLRAEFRAGSEGLTAAALKEWERI